MKVEEQISLNKYGQGLVAIEQLTDMFNLLNWDQKKLFLNNLLYLILQSKPIHEDIEPSIQESGLKPTFTPCVLLQKGVSNNYLTKIVELPEVELQKAIILLLNLFRISYKRRFNSEKNNPNKWWYWDLSDNNKVELIISELMK